MTDVAKSPFEREPDESSGILPTAMRLAVLAIVLFLTCGPSVMAESDPSGARQFIVQETQRLQKKGSTTPANPESNKVYARVAAKKPLVEPTFFVAVLGDSLGQIMGQGLVDVLGDRPEIGVLRKARDSTGLVRDDFYDWPKAAQDLLASQEKLTNQEKLVNQEKLANRERPANQEKLAGVEKTSSPEKINVAVMMVGSNDRRPIKDGSGFLEPFSPKWQEVYAARVTAFASAFRGRKVKLIWVGLPVMRGEKTASESVALNAIYKEHAAKAGAIFVDTQDVFADEKGQFTTYGPDLNGEIVRLRTPDDVHFTKAGARRLAHLIEGEIRALYEASRPTADSILASLNPPGTEPESQPRIIVENQPDISEETIVPPRPLVGPMVLLTAPALAQDGELAIGRKSPVALYGIKPSQIYQPGKMAELVFSQGLPLLPQSNRVDDFSWPKK